MTTFVSNCDIYESVICGIELRSNGGTNVDSVRTVLV
jgi:hypothetical protein